MIKRPLNARFAEKVRAGIKITTIRDKAWPVNQPIMLYSWSGLPYRSPQIDVAAVRVSGFWPITIAHVADDSMRYAYGMECEKPIHETEGFNSKKEMDAWFRLVVKKGEYATKCLMRFELIEKEDA